MSKIYYVLPLIAGALLGTTGYFVRTLYAAGLDAFAILFTRVLIAVIILGIGLHFYDRSLLKIQGKDLLALLSCGLVGTALVIIGYNFATQYLPLSFAAVLLGAAPVFAVIAAVFMFKERITVKSIVFMVIAVVGCVLASGTFEKVSYSGWSVVGLVGGIVAGVCAGIAIQAYRKAGKLGYRFITIVFYGMVLSLLLMFATTSWFAASAYLKADPVKNLGFLVLQSLCLLVLPCVLFSTAIKHVNPGISGVVLAIAELVAATVVGYFVLQEVPTVLGLAGVALAVIAVIGLGRPADILPELQEKQ